MEPKHVALYDREGPLPSTERRYTIQTLHKAREERV